MALEFRVSCDQDSTKELDISVFFGEFKGLQFEIIQKGKNLQFDLIGLDEIKELGLMVNCQMGIDIFNIANIDRAILKENKDAGI